MNEYNSLIDDVDGDEKCLAIVFNFLSQTSWFLDFSKKYGASQ